MSVDNLTTLRVLLRAQAHRVVSEMLLAGVSIEVLQEAIREEVKDGPLVWCLTVAPSPIDAQPTPIASGAGTRVQSDLSVSDRMLLLLRENPESRSWSAREWAARMYCSHSTVLAAKTWALIQSLRAGDRDERSDAGRSDQ